MTRPVIVGCRTDDFSAEQLAAFRQFRPLGLLIFQEPCRAGPDAVRHVIRQFRDAVGDPAAPVFIDQEGGSVNRLKPSFGHGWRAIPAPSVFAGLYRHDAEAAREAIFLNAQLIAYDIRTLGITVDFAPVLDIFTDETFGGKTEDGLHAASGDLKSRMLGDTPEQIITLGRAFCEGLQHQGIVPVIKHIPGYGRVRADPHYSVTRVDTDLATLDAGDFAPFRALADMPAAMTGHVTFTAIDPENSATISPKVIDLIRNRIGFKNLLITDAIEMSAVRPDAFSAALGIDQFRMPLPKSGMIGAITRDALAAGCDIVCHGDNSRDFVHTLEMMEAAPELNADKEARIRRLLKTPAPQVFDKDSALARLDTLLAL